ncbi:MAG TPA: glucoamylase family protein, partial [Vicinamibacterales bacterium]|nr:glucoamylase family protein [Vicinamibacterales bacterium]
ATFNPTFPVASEHAYGWVSPWNFGLNQGPIVLMIENQRTGLIWRLVRQCPYIVQGLRRAGFRGGWL